jgi:hypothetical protein
MAWNEAEGFDVYLKIERVYTGYTRKYDNRSVPSFRTDRYWCARLHGVEGYEGFADGFATKASAITGAREWIARRATGRTG